MQRVPVALVLVTCVLAACATTRAAVSREIWDGGYHNVKLAQLYPAGAETPATFDHPVDFTPDDLFYTLQLFTVAPKESRGYGEAEPVFPRGIARLLAPYLAEAFNEARADEYVTFRFTQKVPGLLFPKYVTTTGSMFVRDGEFHLAIEHFKMQPDEIDRVTYRPDRSSMRGIARLETGEGIRRMADGQTGRLFDHWVAMDWPTLQSKLQARRMARARRDALREERRRREAAPSEDWQLLEGEEPLAVEEGVFFEDEMPPGGEPPDATPSETPVP